MGGFRYGKPPNIIIITQKTGEFLFAFYPIFALFFYGTSHLEKIRIQRYDKNTKKE